MGQGMVRCMVCLGGDSSISPTDDPSADEENPSARNDTHRQENMGSRRDPETVERNEVPDTRSNEGNARERTPTASSGAAEQRGNQTTTPSDTDHQPTVPSSSRAHKEDTPSGYEGGDEKEEKKGRKKKAWCERQKKVNRAKKNEGPDPKRSENIPSDTSDSDESN